MSQMLVLVRAIHFGSTLWLFGAFGLLVFVVGPALRVVAAPAPMLLEQQERLLRVATGCVAVGIASSVAWLLLEAASMSGAPLVVAINRETLGKVVCETLFGRVWSARLALSLAVAATLGWVWSRRSRPMGSGMAVGSMLLAGAYAATLAGAGHAAAHSGTDRYVHLTGDAVHLLAAGAWAGALPGLLSLLTDACRSGQAGRLTLAVAATRRFSVLGMISVGALVLTGLINACFLVGTFAALYETPYGRLLLWKLAAFAIMVALAAVNRFVLAPRLAATDASTGNAAGVAALARLRRNAMLEIAAAVAIVGIVAALGLTMPAMHMHDDQPAHSMPMERAKR